MPNKAQNDPLVVAEWISQKFFTDVTGSNREDMLCYLKNDKYVAITIFSEYVGLYVELWAKEHPLFERPLTDESYAALVVYILSTGLLKEELEQMSFSEEWEEL